MAKKELFLVGPIRVDRHSEHRIDLMYIIILVAVLCKKEFDSFIKL